MIKEATKEDLQGISQILKEATKEDLQGISQILKEVHNLHEINRNDIFKELKEPINMNYYEKLLDDDKYKIYIEIENNIILGYLVIRIIEVNNHPVLKNKKIIGIEDLAVLKKYHKKGFGSQLFDKALVFAKEENADKLELHVWSFNKQAQDFYLYKGMKNKSSNFELEL